MPTAELARLGVVVHPERDLRHALATLQDWASRRSAEVVQIRVPGNPREVAPAGTAESSDLVVALGGDGTTLAALHAAAAVNRPVLGVACGSLGALSAVTADEIGEALDRVEADDWHVRAVPALLAHFDGGEIRAINDLVLVRRGAGQIAVEVRIGGERFVGFAGDGLIAATPLGSTAYTLASGGPMLAPGTDGLVLTPLAPHGGVCPPVVTAPGTEVLVTLDPAHGGARIEADGRPRHEAPPFERVRFELTYEPRFAELVALGMGESLITGLRRRRILIDSPRMQIRDDRAAAQPR